jgi:hypothetical protein
VVTLALDIDEPPCNDEPSTYEPSCNEPSNDTPCQIESPCKPVYERSTESLRHRVKLSIRHQNKLSNQTQLKPSFKSPYANDVANTPCDSIIQGVIIAVDELTSAGWYWDVFTFVDRWKHRPASNMAIVCLGTRLDPTTSPFYGVLYCF